MQGDSFQDFISQGPIIRLVITTAFFGMLWLGTTAWVGQRARERRRRKREGLPPMPNMFTQAWNLYQNRSTNPTQKSAASVGSDYGYGVPSVHALTSDLPLPDVDSFLALPASSSPKPVQPSPAAKVSEPVYEMRIGDESDSDVPVGFDPIHSDSDAYIPQSGELPADTIELMRVWRDVSDGSLIIQMEGMLFQTVPEMKDRGKARRFINLVKDLASMAQAGAQAAGLPPPDFQSSTAVISQHGAWASQKVSTTPIITPMARMDGLDASAEPNGGGTGDTIAEQIEELLQYRLRQTPIFQYRSIHVRPNFDGSLRIVVDGHHYESVGDVVDVDVREFLQSVIREWEARQ